MLHFPDPSVSLARVPADPAAPKLARTRVEQQPVLAAELDNGIDVRSRLFGPAANRFENGFVEMRVSHRRDMTAVRGPVDRLLRQLFGPIHFAERPEHQRKVNRRRDAIIVPVQVCEISIAFVPINGERLLEVPFGL